MNQKIDILRRNGYNRHISPEILDERAAYETVYGYRKSARRLRKIVGRVQVIDVDVPCEDVLSQMNAVRSAMHKCGQNIMEDHINNCVHEGIEHGDSDATITKFTKVVERFANMK